ncbi:MAG TPA: cytochrome B5 [Dehalococcoidia bacterium]|nr:cytochrome B5 [Dehalococcoidia bacterium]
MRTFTREELKKYDGRNGPAYIACDGRVYDVSGSFLWQKGKHQAMHFAGNDLTGALKEAPHGPDLLERYPIVGELID